MSQLKWQEQDDKWCTDVVHDVHMSAQQTADTQLCRLQVTQRPEMHRIHHRHGVHKNNYGDITWWDMLFGTYENPKEWTHTCGFDPDKEEKLLAMLMYQDVHEENE